jgi:hypothetical protein
LPVGATVSDGRNSTAITDRNAVVNVTGWNLNSLTVTVPQNQDGGGEQCGSNGSSFDLQVVATIVEPANGSMASIAKNITVQLLSGRSCATPVGVNPYVSYANSKAATQTTGPVIDGLVASPLVPVNSSYALVVPTGGNGTVTQPASVADLYCTSPYVRLDASLFAWCAGVSRSSLAAAVFSICKPTSTEVLELRCDPVN